MNIEVIKSLVWYCLKERDVECLMLLGFKDREMVIIHEHSRGDSHQTSANINNITNFCTRHNINDLYIAHNHIYHTNDWGFEVKASKPDKDTVNLLIKSLNKINVNLKASFIVTKKNVICHLKEKT